jgi:hypothetical protein
VDLQYTAGSPPLCKLFYVNGCQGKCLLHCSSGAGLTSITVDAAVVPFTFSSLL